MSRRSFYRVVMVACALALLWQAPQVDWPRFAAAFVLIDLVGYLPGTLAFRRAGGGRIAPLYHHLYNVTHSFVTAAVVVGIWALAAGFEWAMLAIPLHLAGDRGLFGNRRKPVDRPFEQLARGAS